jgi:hypothetical protein
MASARPATALDHAIVGVVPRWRVSAVADDLRQIGQKQRHVRSSSASRANLRAARPTAVEIARENQLVALFDDPRQRCLGTPAREDQRRDQNVRIEDDLHFAR